MRFDRTPHPRVNINQPLDVDLCTTRIPACLDRTKVLTRILHTDFDGIRRIIVILDNEFCLSVPARMRGVPRIAHDEDAAPVQAALGIRLDGHTLDILDAQRSAVDGDGIRRALPTGVRSLSRQEAVTTGTRLNVEAMTGHVDRAVNVAVPVDRAELVVLCRDDRIIRRTGDELHVLAEGIVALAVIDTLRLPVGFRLVRIEIGFGDLLVNSLLRQRIRFRGLHIGTPVGFPIIHISCAQCP